MNGKSSMYFPPCKSFNSLHEVHIFNILKYSCRVWSYSAVIYLHNHFTAVGKLSTHPLLWSWRLHLKKIFTSDSVKFLSLSLHMWKSITQKDSKLFSTSQIRERNLCFTFKSIEKCLSWILNALQRVWFWQGSFCSENSRLCCKCGFVRKTFIKKKSVDL